jgi:uncharacterized protein YbaA (DUF1428 family)
LLRRAEAAGHPASQNLSCSLLRASPLSQKQEPVRRLSGSEVQSSKRKCCGALEYRECAGDDLDVKWGVTFLKLLKLKPGETAVFSWIVFKSKAHRGKVNAKVMKDPRLGKMMDKMMDPKAMPFDHKRMVFGGFKVIVDA